MEKDQDNFNTQTLSEHLADLRSCLVYSMLAIMIGFGAAYGIIRPVAGWFFAPLVKVLPETTSLIFMSYQEGFFFT
ncbi:MAG: preprotein translocase [Desulfobulbus propionicus]|nr:MAG: preprotein translocase [Desulfobulbus propionicus]